MEINKSKLFQVIGQLTKAGAEVRLENRDDYLTTYAVISIPLSSLTELEDPGAYPYWSVLDSHHSEAED